MIASPDDVFQALIDAQADLNDDDAALFRAKLILLLADRVGDDEAVKEAIGMAREGLGVVREGMGEDEELGSMT